MPPATAESERVSLDPAELGFGDDAEIGVDFVGDSDEDQFGSATDTDSEPSSVYDDLLDPNASQAEQSLMDFLDANPLDGSLDEPTDFASPNSNPADAATGASPEQTPHPEAAKSSEQTADDFNKQERLDSSTNQYEIRDGRMYQMRTEENEQRSETNLDKPVDLDPEVLAEVLNLRDGEEYSIELLYAPHGTETENVYTVLTYTRSGTTDSGLPIITISSSTRREPKLEEDEKEESTEEVENSASYGDGDSGDGLDVEDPTEADEQEAPTQPAPIISLSEGALSGQPATETKPEPTASEASKNKEATQTIEAEAKSNSASTKPEAPTTKSAAPPAPATPDPTAPKPETPRPPIAPPEPTALDIGSEIDSASEPAPSSFGISGQSEPAPVESRSGMETSVPKPAPKLTPSNAKTPTPIAPKPMIAPRPNTGIVSSQPQPSELILHAEPILHAESTPHTESTQASADETDTVDTLEATDITNGADTTTATEPEVHLMTSDIVEPAPARPKGSPSTGPSAPDGGGGGLAAPAAVSRPETSTTTAPTVTAETPSFETTHVETASAPEISHTATSRLETLRTETSPVTTSRPEAAKVETPTTDQAISTEHHTPAYTAEPEVFAPRVEAFPAAPETRAQTPETAPSQSQAENTSVEQPVTTATEVASPIEIAGAAKPAEIHTYPQAKVSPRPQIADSAPAAATAESASIAQIVEPTITAQTVEPVIEQASKPIVAQAVELGTAIQEPGPTIQAAAPAHAETVPMTFEDILAAPIRETAIATEVVLQDPLAQEPLAAPLTKPAEITSWLEDFGMAVATTSEAAHITAPASEKIETQSQKSPMPTERDEGIETDEIVEIAENAEIDESAEEDKADEVVAVVTDSRANHHVSARPAATHYAAHAGTNLLADASENKSNYDLFSAANPTAQRQVDTSFEAFRVPTHFASAYSPTRASADTNASSANDADTDNDGITINFEAEEHRATRPAYARTTRTATAEGDGFGGDA